MTPEPAAFAGEPPERQRARRRVLRPFARFFGTETSGAVVLFAATIAALVWANGPFGHSYRDFWSEHLRLSLGNFDLAESLRGWVNDGLMTLFFLVVGLEIKREVVRGELRNPRTAILPVIAAAGGMLVPAVVYLALNAGEGSTHGWAVPVATDIAFAVGVLALVASHVPPALRVFLLALAIADDIGGIVVIALFYAGDLSLGWLAVAAGALVVVFGARALGVRPIPVYVVIGAVAWYATREAGIHPTIAGVALGLLTPAHPHRGQDILPRLENGLHPWTSYVIVPLFALANAGVQLGVTPIREAFHSSVAWGVMLGLLIGKPIGITAATLLAVRLRLGRLPHGVRRVHLVGVAIVAGVGFTVALFIGNLAFAQTPELLDHAKIGIFAGSLASGLLGAGALLLAPRIPSRARRRPAGG